MEAAIVGGGIGGMMTALYLANRGAGVTLFERGALGGRLAYQTDGGAYRIDRGPTIVLLPEMLMSLLEQAGLPRSSYSLLPCEPMYRIHYPDGESITKWRDPDRMAAELNDHRPGDGEGFLRYMAEMEPAFKAAQGAFLERTFLTKRSFFTVRNLLLLQRLRIHQSVRGYAERFFHSPRSIDAFSLQTLYVGGLPYRSPSLYTFIPYAEHAFGIGYLKGGYAGLVPLLEKRLRRAGVDIRLGEAGTVQGIRIERGQVDGLQTAAGAGVLEPFRRIVYNGDFPHLAPLLSGSGRLPRSRSAYTPSTGCLLVYLGTDRRWPEAAAHQFFLPDSLTDSLKAMESGVHDGRARQDIPSYYVFNPCALDADAAPDGHSVLYVLIPMPPRPTTDWPAGQYETGELVERVLADAERRGFPGLTASTRWRSVRTPADGEAEGWFGGGAFGLAPTLGQSGVFRPQIVPYPIRGLYSVGASVHPGGGIPIVMQGARLLADHLIKEWKA